MNRGKVLFAVILEIMQLEKHKALIFLIYIILGIFSTDQSSTLLK